MEEVAEEEEVEAVEAVEAVAVEEEDHLVVHLLHKLLLRLLLPPITMAEDWWERNWLYSMDQETRVRHSSRSLSCTPTSMRTTMRLSNHLKGSSWHCPI